MSDSNGVEYLSTLTRAMDADVTFSVNGETVSGAENLDLSYDFNGDGRVTTADAQHLLDHVTKGTALAANASQADLNGDGVVNTYDVHLFLALCQASVEVPASGSVTVNVSMTLTDAEKARLAATPWAPMWKPL